MGMLAGRLAADLLPIAQLKVTETTPDDIRHMVLAARILLSKSDEDYETADGDIYEFFTVEFIRVKISCFDENGVEITN